MSQIKAELQYTRTHEWVLNNGDGTWTIGLTDHAQILLSDIIFIELPKVNFKIKITEELCVVESVKVASSIYAPSNLIVLSINNTLEDRPEMVNEDCYGKGYLLTFRADDSLSNLLNANAYQALLDSE